MEMSTIQTDTYLHDQSLFRIAWIREEQLYEQKREFSEEYSILTLALLAKDPELYTHSYRVQALTSRLISTLNLPKNEAAAIELAALFHDIGKIDTPELVLHKKTTLTKQEFEHIKKHPATGAEMLRQTRTLANIANLVLSHHEHWDGYGYPYGLLGCSIPLGSRIIAVADAFEVMTARRCYQTTRTPQEAFDELRRCAGKQFDPFLVDRFCDSFDTLSTASLGQEVGQHIKQVS